jgi:hypothetical protein
VEANPNIQAPALANLLQKYDTGELPSHRTIRRILLEMKQDTSLYDEKEHADLDYQAIPSACERFRQNNPGSIAVCETNNDIMAQVFTKADPDEEGSASKATLCTQLQNIGYDSKDIETVFQQMNLETDDSTLSIPKEMFMAHFASKFGRFCVIFRHQVLRCVRSIPLFVTVLG